MTWAVTLYTHTGQAVVVAMARTELDCTMIVAALRAAYRLAATCSLGGDA